MADWALYLDEAGSTDPHKYPLASGQTPLFSLGGVALPFDRWRDFDREYLYLKREFFAAELDRSSKNDTAWEIKGSDLLAPRNKGSERNRVFCYRVIDLIKKFDGKCLGVTFLKSVASPMNRASIYTKGLQIIAERYDTLLREISSTGLIILDSRTAHIKRGGGLDYTVAVSYLSYVFGHKDGKLLRSIIEAPLFADSGLSAGLQIADIIAALIYTNAYREKLCEGQVTPGLPDYSHTKCFFRPFKETVFESVSLYGGHRMFGLRTIDHRDGRQAPAGDSNE